MGLVYDQLMDAPGRVAYPVLPDKWDRVYRQYIAILRPGLDGGVVRDWMSKVVQRSRTGKTARLARLYELEELTPGCLLEVCRKGRYRGARGRSKPRCFEVYRLDWDGWRLVASRRLPGSWRLIE
jgi:hypothetical protein